jgi:ribosome-associated protein
MMTEPNDLARRIAEIASDALATNITVLDITELSTIADVFVICSADNTRQLNALRETVIGKLKEDDNIAPRRLEGVAEAGWIVLDYGDVIVHLFTEEQRLFYQLETVWAKAQKLLVIQ